MECSCDLSAELSGYGPQCLKQITRKARKDHKCTECHAVIIKGQTYKYQSGIWDGEPNSFKICLNCFSIQEVFFRDGCIYGETFSELKQFIADCCGDVPSSCLAKLTKGARDKVCDMIEAYWEEVSDEQDS